MDSRPTTPNRTVETVLYNVATARNTTMSSKQMNSSPSPPPTQCCLSLKTNAYNSCLTQDNIEGGRGEKCYPVDVCNFTQSNSKIQVFFQVVSSSFVQGCSCRNKAVMSNFSGIVCTGLK